MAVDWKQYSLAELKAHATQTYRQGSGSRPAVLLIDIAGEKAVLKDQNSTDKWFAFCIGRLLTWRECKALSKLSDVAGIPNLLHRPDRRSFLMAYHQAEQVNKLTQSDPNWDAFFQKLVTLIEQIHQRGIAHNDLRNPSNILVNQQDEPILVDLVACFCRGQRWNLPNIWLFNKFCNVDHSAVTKLKSRVAPELISDSDIHAQQIAGKTGMAARRLGQIIRQISRKLFTAD